MVNHENSIQMVNEIIIRPKVDELENEKARYECPLPSCTATLRGIGFVPSHLRKVHNVVINNEGTNSDSDNGTCSTLQCFCPILSCKYSGQGMADRHFTSLKLLRQHFMKVHAEKKYKCEKCGLSFGLDRDRRLHQGRCGQIYKCTDCEAEYSTIEALQTHCLRNRHRRPPKPPKIAEENVDKQKEENAPANHGTSISTQTSGVGMMTPLSSIPVILVEVTPKTPVDREILTKSLSMKPILPKPSVKLIVQQQTPPVSNVSPYGETGTESESPEQLGDFSSQTTEIGDIFNGSVSEGIQTSLGDKNLESGDDVPSLLEKSWSSTGIQTAITFKPQRKKQLGTVAQTQTSGDIILKKAMESADIPIQMESVGTQMTPQLKGQSFKRRTCTTETQTQNEGPSKPKKRRKSLLNVFMTDSISQTSAESNAVKMDSMCQVDNFKHFTLVDISKSSTTQAAQTEKFIRIDTMSQTKEQMQEGPQSLKKKNNVSQNGQNLIERNEKSSRATDSSSKINHQISNTAIQYKTRITTPGEHPFSDAETGPILSVTEEQGETSEERTVSLTDSSTSADTDSSSLQVPKSDLNIPNENRVPVPSTTVNTESTSIQVSEAEIPSNLNIPSESRVNDMGIQTFEADFESFLLSQCDNLERPGQTETHVQTQSTATDIDVLLQMTDKETNPPEISMDTQTQTADLDIIDSWMNHMETQTSTDPAFNSFSFNDIETQTLPDLSLDTSDDSSFMNEFSLTSIQTQTMEDDLYQSLSTQTDNFLNMFDFPLTSIHTQTSGQSDHASTQTTQSNTQMTEIGVGSDIADVIYSSNTETQTTDLGLSDTHTQTAWDSLDNLLREFQK
ncbi:ATM interactor-like [Saccostrea echinata]|uniref:ATM interactor-like n=1 Tax=Saccostrea echinata TaxID=191078 RepID=UPI002A8391EA|nr:ATM interactor-like [Saccostrea echinata]